MSFLAGAILLTGAVVFFVLQPILFGRSTRLDRDVDEPTEAEARRRVTLMALRDVEYDHATGKLDEEDYRQLRRELSAEALEALEAEQEEREALEPDPATPSTADLEAEIARVRQGLKEGTTCAGCGYVNTSGSRFCSICGHALVESGPQ